MPDKIVVLNIIGVILQYGFVAMIYLFLAQIIKAIYTDLKMPLNSNAGKAVLTVVDSGDFKFAQQKYNISEMLSIGRASSNDIVIEDTFVSHEHVCIAKERDEYFITDLNSTNGTLLNGERLSAEKKLTYGDLIKIGPAVFKFER